MLLLIPVTNTYLLFGITPIHTTKKKMAKKPTGNATVITFSFPVIARMKIVMKKIKKRGKNLKLNGTILHYIRTHFGAGTTVFT